MKKKIILISADKEIIELIREFKDIDLLGILDKSAKGTILDVKILGKDDAWPRLSAKFSGLKAVLAIDPTLLRRKLAKYYGINSLLSIISKYAHVSTSAAIGQGSIIQKGVNILSCSSVGKACKININATVHHDVIIGDYCTLAPGCQILGNVRIDEGVFIGAGAIILPRVRIGKGSIIGVGAVVVSDIAKEIVAAGVPAKKLRKI